MNLCCHRVPLLDLKDKDVEHASHPRQDGLQ